MTALFAILFGILQGLTEFLPVSSFGHVSAIQNALGISGESSVLFVSMLHLGTLVGLFAVFQKEIRRVLSESVGMAMDIIGNLNLYVHNRRTGDDLHYTRVVTGTYRKLTAMLVVTSIPTALLGFGARRLVQLTSVNHMAAGIGLLLTGVFLIVVDFSGAGNKKNFFQAGYDTALWIGIFQGLSVFPGISRAGFTIGSGLLCGLSRKMAVKYSFLASIPAILGAFLVETPKFVTSGLTAGQGFLYVLGMLFAAVTGYFVIEWMLHIAQNAKLRYFAFYCFLAGAVALAINFSI